MTTNLPETVTIKTADYLELLRSDLTLTELEAAGVDNWDGYGEYDRGKVRARLASAKAALVAGVTNPVTPWGKA